MMRIRSSQLIRLLSAFGVVCYCAFLALGLITAVSGLTMIWAAEEPWGPSKIQLIFYSAFLLTVITGLFVSGTRSMIGAIVDGRWG